MCNSLCKKTWTRAEKQGYWGQFTKLNNVQGQWSWLGDGKLFFTMQEQANKVAN